MKKEKIIILLILVGFVAAGNVTAFFMGNYLNLSYTLMDYVKMNILPVIASVLLFMLSTAGNKEGDVK